MKRAISLILAVMMCLSLCACGGEKGSNNLSLGQTASTDLVDFTLEHSEFTYYVSNVSTNFVEPTDEPNSLFAASLGHCYVSATFTITNKDRGGSIRVGGEGKPVWSVSYNNADYSVKGFDLNNSAGSGGLNLGHNAAILDKTTNTVIKVNETTNYLLHAGETVTIRTFGVVDVDPENLTDGFDLTISIPNSKSERENFTYTIPAQN